MYVCLPFVTAEWWIHFGQSAPNLKTLAIRILSQTVSSSGCERNWSTFGLIHSKSRNRLTQKRLNDLVYVHYNLRLRLKCVQDEVQLRYTDPTIDDYAIDDEDPMIGWLAGQQQEPELDEPGSPPRPASVVAREIRVDPGQWAERNIPHRVPADQPQPEGSRGSHSSRDSMSQMLERQMLTRGRSEKGKGKATAVASASRVQESEDSDSETSGSDSDGSSHGSDDQGGTGGYETTVHETQPEAAVRFTGESQFSHATQDRDHGGRPDRPREQTISYRRRPPRGRTPHDTAADDLARGVGSMDVSGSSSYYGSYHPQPAYDPYGYGVSEASASSGYYPTQPGASYGSDIAAGIFGWAPPQPYYHPEDTAQSQGLSQSSDISYNPDRIPHGMNVQEYGATWIEGWTDLPPDYADDPDVYDRHRHSTRF